MNVDGDQGSVTWTRDIDTDSDDILNRDWNVLYTRADTCIGSTSTTSSMVEGIGSSSSGRDVDGLPRVLTLALGGTVRGAPIEGTVPCGSYGTCVRG